MKNRIIIAVIILSVVFLSSCGNKGDLYLPDKEKESNSQGSDEG